MSGAVTLGALAEGRDNNFRLIRFIAASSVILSHGYVVNLGLGGLAYDPLERLTGVDSGELAVDVFFVTSGFLVARSLLHRRDLVDYVLSRVLRITPALAVSVLLAAFVLGPLVTQLPLGSYFATRSLYSYVVIDSLSLSPFHQRFELPGVFASSPYPNVVNAPLWTLPWEIWMYGVLLALFVVRATGRALPLFLGVVLAGYMAMRLGVWDAGMPAWIGFRFLAFFFCGVALVTHGARLPLTWVPLLVHTAVFTAISVATQSTVLLPLWLAHAVIFAAYAPSMVVHRLSHGPDYSYGMYIYAYMVQQTLVWWWGAHDPLLNAAVALLLTLPLAMGSWHLIEEPALMFKQRLRQKRHLPAAPEALA